MRKLSFVYVGATFLQRYPTQDKQLVTVYTSLKQSDDISFTKTYFIWGYFLTLLQEILLWKNN